MEYVKKDDAIKAIAERLSRYYETTPAAIWEPVAKLWLKDVPTFSRWIPAEERLPEPDDFQKRYLVTVNNAGNVFILISCFVDGGNGPTWEDDEGIIDSRNVTAWTPLPAPYQEGGVCD